MMIVKGCVVLKGLLHITVYSETINEKYAAWLYMYTVKID